MRFGDLLEIIAAGFLTYGVYELAGEPWAAIAAASCLVYLAQCYGATPIQLPKVRFPKRKRAEL